MPYEMTVKIAIPDPGYLGTCGQCFLLDDETLICHENLNVLASCDSYHYSGRTKHTFSCPGPNCLAYKEIIPFILVNGERINMSKEISEKLSIFTQDLSVRLVHKRQYLSLINGKEILYSTKEDSKDNESWNELRKQLAKVLNEQ